MQLSSGGCSWVFGLEVVCLSVSRTSLMLISAVSATGYVQVFFFCHLQVTNGHPPNGHPRIAHGLLMGLQC